MPVGFVAYADDGTPQTIDFSVNFAFVQSGTVNIGSNTAALGASGNVTLPTTDLPYIVFVKTDAASSVYIQSTTSGFSYFLPQGSTTFQYWAYARSPSTSNVGMQVFEADGKLRWHLGNRPLAISSLQNGPAAPGVPAEMSTVNMVAATNQLTIPNGHAALISDPGHFFDLYANSGGGATLQPNMRFWPCINTNGTVLKINYGRMYANRGTLGAGVTYQTTVTHSPSFVLTAPAF